jgi:hypothetical protein
MLLNAEIRRAKLAVAATATRDLGCPAGHLALLITWISSDLGGFQQRLPAALAGKTFSASPSTRQSTPQRIRCSSGCSRSCHIFPARRLYQPGVELFQQGMMAYQFAK